MNKRILFFVAIMALLAATVGQAAKLEFNVGITQSTLITSFQETMATGFRVGAGWGLRLGNSLSLQPEIAFVRRGTGTATLSWGLEGLSSRVWVDYLALPVMVRLRLGRSDRMRPFLQAGVYGAWMVGAKGETRYEGVSLSESYREEVRDLDLGVAGGFGLETRLGGRPVSVELRYDLGLAQVNERQMVNDWRNRTLSLMVGMRI